MIANTGSDCAARIFSIHALHPIASPNLGLRKPTPRTNSLDVRIETTPAGTRAQLSIADIRGVHMPVEATGLAACGAARGLTRHDSPRAARALSLRTFSSSIWAL